MEYADNAASAQKLVQPPQPKQQRTFGGINSAVVRVRAIRCQLEDMLDRVNPLPRAVEQKDVAGTNAPPSYARSLAELSDELNELSDAMDALSQHI